MLLTKYTGKYLTFFEKDGYEFVSRNNNKKAVIIIPYLLTDDGIKFQCIIQNRPTFDRDCLEFPAGLIDEDDFLDSAVRELEEETRWRCNKNDLEILALDVPTGEGSSIEIVNMVKIDLSKCIRIDKDDPTLLQDSDSERIFICDLMTISDIFKCREDNNLHLSGRVAMLGLLNLK